jgi:hypothetical protein
MTHGERPVRGVIEVRGHIADIFHYAIGIKEVGGPG